MPPHSFFSVYIALMRTRANFSSNSTLCGVKQIHAKIMQSAHSHGPSGKFPKSIIFWLTSSCTQALGKSYISLFFTSPGKASRVSTLSAVAVAWHCFCRAKWCMLKSDETFLLFRRFWLEQKWTWNVEVLAAIKMRHRREQRLTRAKILILTEAVEELNEERSEEERKEDLSIRQRWWRGKEEWVQREETSGDHTDKSDTTGRFEEQKEKQTNKDWENKSSGEYTTTFSRTADSKQEWALEVF